MRTNNGAKGHTNKHAVGANQGGEASGQMTEAIRACRKSAARSRKSRGAPSFQGLLTISSPKQSASNSFWRRTVQSPAKPKPFFNQSIASKPAMVRFAVAKLWKPPIFGMFFF